MKVLNIIMLIGLLSLLSACFTVRTVNSEASTRCNLVTKEFKIDFSENILGESNSSGFSFQTTNHQSNQVPEVLLLALVAVPVGSFIVSGSIAVVGNMVHWVEKQGRCEDSAVRTFTSSINQSITSAGGMVIDSYDSFLNWLKENN